MLSSPLSALPRWPLSPRFSAKAELDDETWLSFTGAAYVIIIQRRWRGKVARKNVEQRRALARALESARAAGQTRRRRVTRTLLSIAFVLFTLYAALLISFAASNPGVQPPVGLIGPPAACVLLLAISPTDARSVYAVCTFMCALLLAAAIGWTRHAIGIAANHASGSDASTGQTWDVDAPPDWVRTYSTARIVHYAAIAAVCVVICGFIAITTLRPALGVAAGKRCFAVPPRVALINLWRVFRLFGVLVGSVILGATIACWTNPAYGAKFNLGPCNLLVVAMYFGVSGYVSARRRGRLLSFLGSLGHHDEVGAAAAVATMVGRGTSPAQTLARAATSFRGLSFSALSKSDFKTNEDTGLHGRTQPCALGEVDVFLSHSWRDSCEHKWTALAAYAASHEAVHGTKLMLWLDKVQRTARRLKRPSTSRRVSVC